MANKYLSIKLDISNFLSILKIGSYINVTFPTPPSPDPVYTFTFYKGIKLDISNFISNLKIGVSSSMGSGQQQINNSIKLDMSDFLNLKIGMIPHGSANIGLRLLWKNLSWR
jgi:hypothetical protein